MKKWTQSKTMWANGLAFVASVAAFTGYDMGLTAEVQTSIVVGIMALMNMGLRKVTNKGLE